MDLVTVQCRLRIRYVYQLRVKQRRQQITPRFRNTHIEQTRLSNNATDRSALVPIFDNWVSEFDAMRERPSIMDRRTTKIVDILRPQS
ncbi:MAG: hypothetical protein ACJ8G3_13510 [Burkholderiaceae bacterium]